MTPEEFMEIMKDLEKQYDRYISMGQPIDAQYILQEMEHLEADYGRGL